jgi:hypothetical protein
MISTAPPLSEPSTAATANQLSRGLSVLLAAKCAHPAPGSAGAEEAIIPPAPARCTLAPPHRRQLDRPTSGCGRTDAVVRVDADRWLLMGESSSECNPEERLLHVQVVGRQLTIAVLAPGPICGKRLTRERFPSPPPGHASVREPRRTDRWSRRAAGKGRPRRHSSPVTACSDARPSAGRRGRADRGGRAGTTSEQLGASGARSRLAARGRLWVALRADAFTAGRAHTETRSGVDGSRSAARH